MTDARSADPSTIGEMIMTAREERGWSAVELGERIGCSATTVRAWEQGRRMPEPEVIPALAEVLELDARDLVSSVTPAKPPDVDDTGRPWHDRDEAWLSPEQAGKLDETDPADSDEIDGTRELDHEAGASGDPSSSPVETPATPHDPTDGSASGLRPADPSDPVPADPDSDGFFSMAPVDAIRADQEIVPAGRPDVPATGGVDIAQVIERAARWVRDSWRRRRLLARAPTSVKSYVEDDRQATTYRIRQVLTAATLIVLVLVLRWAWSQFAEAVTSLFDTLRTAL